MSSEDSDDSLSNDSEEVSYIPPDADNNFVLLDNSIFTRQSHLKGIIDTIDKAFLTSNSIYDLYLTATKGNNFSNNDILQQPFVSLFGGNLYDEGEICLATSASYDETELKNVLRESFGSSRNQATYINENLMGFNTILRPFLKNDTNILTMKRNVNSILLSLFVHEDLNYYEEYPSTRENNYSFISNLVCGPKYVGSFFGTNSTVSSVDASGKKRILDCMYEDHADFLVQLCSDSVIYMFPYMIGEKESDMLQSSDNNPLPSEGPDGELMDILSLYDPSSDSISYLESKKCITFGEVRNLFSILNVSYCFCFCLYF